MLIRLTSTAIGRLGTAAIALPFLSLTLSQPAIATCTFFSQPQRYNTQISGDVIVIGEQRDRPYKVIVVSDEALVRDRIQACVLDAFETRSELGDFIRVGSFTRRGDAEALRRILQRAGYDARVTYRRAQ